MVDIPPTAAVAPPVPPPVAATNNVTPVEATVSNVPDKIQQLVRQIQVNATISQLPGDGTITLNSIIGSLTILLPQLVDAQQQKLLQQLLTFLQNQKPITLVIQPGNPPTQAFLLLPTTSGAPQPANAAETNTLLQAAIQQRPPLAVGNTLPAIVLPSNIVLPTNTAAAQQPSVLAPPLNAPSIPGALTLIPAQDIIPELLPNLIAGDLTAKAQIKTDQSLLQTQGQILSNTPPPQNIAATTVSSRIIPTTAVNIGPAPAAALLQPGNEVSLRIDAVIPPPITATATAATSVAPNLPTPGPNQIIATVTGNGPNGQVILQAGDTTLYVKQSANAPVGTNLLVTVEQAKTATLLPLAIPDTPNFAALQQVLTTLAQIDPQLAQQVIANHIPQPTAGLPGALLFFMSAFKQGDVRNWLGADAVDALTRAGKFELLAKLTQELTNTGQTAQDAVVGEWRSYPIPLQANNQFQIVNFYVHGQGERDAGKNAAGARAAHTRFLIDVRMSKLGAMQLDGFVQPKKLDMIVRSENILPEGLHRNLRETYTRALTGIDYAGSLNFQVGRQHWLIIQKAAHKAAITT